MRCSKMRLKCYISNRAITGKPGHSATGWTPVHFTEEMRSTRMVQHGWNGGCSENFPNRWPLMTPGLCWPLMTPGLCFCTRSASRIRHNVVFKSRHTVTSKGYIWILQESLLWEEHMSKTRITTTEGLTTCIEPHTEWTIASSTWIFLGKQWLDRITVIQEETKRMEEKEEAGYRSQQHGRYYEHCKGSTKQRDLKATQ